MEFELWSTELSAVHEDENNPLPERSEFPDALSPIEEQNPLLGRELSLGLAGHVHERERVYRSLNSHFPTFVRVDRVSQIRAFLYF